VQFETAVVRDAVVAAAQAGADLATLRYIRAADLLLATYARTTDSSYLRPARGVLDYIADSGEGGPVGAGGESARDDPPEIQRAGWLRDLTAAWAVTADARYRDASRAVARRCARHTGPRRGPRAISKSRRTSWACWSGISRTPRRRATSRRWRRIRRRPRSPSAPMPRSTICWPPVTPRPGACSSGSRTSPETCAIVDARRR